MGNCGEKNPMKITVFFWKPPCRDLFWCVTFLAYCESSFGPSKPCGNLSVLKDMNKMQTCRDFPAKISRKKNMKIHCKNRNKTNLQQVKFKYDLIRQVLSHGYHNTSLLMTAYKLPMLQTRCCEAWMGCFLFKNRSLIAHCTVVGKMTMVIPNPSSVLRLFRGYSILIIPESDRFFLLGRLSKDQQISNFCHWHSTWLHSTIWWVIFGRLLTRSFAVRSTAAVYEPGTEFRKMMVNWVNCQKILCLSFPF